MTDLPFPSDRLSSKDNARVARLRKSIKFNPTNLEAYAELLIICRQYQLSQQSRAIREHLRSSRALSEAQWIEWLMDEAAQNLASQSDQEIVHQWELYEQSIIDHPISTTLWLRYIEFASVLQGRELQNAIRLGPDTLAPESRLRTAPSLLDVITAAAIATRFNIAKSREIWCLRLDLAIQAVSRSDLKLDEFFSLFTEQLEIPHLRIDLTFSEYSTAVTNHDNEHYEERMVVGNSIYQRSLKFVTECVPYESALTDSEDAVDVYSRYIDWQLQRPAKEPYHQELTLALIHRAVLRHPRVSSLWMSGYHYLSKHHSVVDSVALDDYTSQAVRNCPSSGQIWSAFIRANKCRTGRSDEALETCTKALVNFDPETHPHDILNVISSTFLSLRSAEDTSDSTEPARFVSRMLRQYKTIEDQHFLLYRLLVECQTSAGMHEEARKSWRTASKLHGSKALFWLRYFGWELAHGNTSLARSVIKNGCMKTTDAPQIVYEAAETFELQFGDIFEYEKTTAVVRKAIKQFVEATAFHNEQEMAEQEPAQESSQVPTKRKLQDVQEGLTTAPEQDKKRQKSSEQHDSTIDLERSRESTSIIVRGLHQATSDQDLSTFFHDCGTIKKLTIHDTQQSENRIAVVEFELSADRLAAETKTLKELHGNTITVESAQGSVLFVTNWPPSYQEHHLRSLFETCGNVLEVRMPSLMFDQQRRFAYLQMASKEEATAGLELDGRETEGEYTLSVAISDPSAKRGRSDAALEQRELFVKKISWKANQTEVEAVFSQYGTILSLRMPKTISSSHHDGIAFIDYDQARCAEAALKLDGTLINGMAIQVSLAKPRTSTRRSGPPGPSQKIKGLALDNDRSLTTAAPNGSEIQAKTLGIMDLADTVNEAQLRSLFAPFGALRKVQLRPDHGGAVVEFDHAADAGRATLALSGQELGHRQFVIGRYEDLMQRPSAQTKGFNKDVLTMAPRKARSRPTKATPGSRTGPSKSSTATDVAMSNDHDSSTVAGTENDQTMSTLKDQDFFRNLLKSGADVEGQQ